MPQTTTRTRDLLESLLRVRTMGENHRAQLVTHLESFAAATGDDLAAFNDATVNDWIRRYLLTSDKAPKTQKAYRASILNAWRTFYAAGLVDRPPGLIVGIGSTPAPPIAWTLHDLRALRSACDEIERGDWAAALMELTWSTGLRRCDAYGFTSAAVDTAGVYRLVQQKTGHAHACHVSADAARALSLVGGQLETLDRAKAARVFRELREAAGLKQGTARWLRRSAASYVEKERPGQGVAFLGHQSQTVASRHYFDPSITGNFVKGPSQRLQVAPST